MSDGVEELVMACGDCGQQLAHIVVDKYNPGFINRDQKPFKTTIKIINCPNCGGSTFSTPALSGSTRIKSHRDDIKLSEVSTEVENQTISIVLSAERV